MNNENTPKNKYHPGRPLLKVIDYKADGQSAVATEGEWYKKDFPVTLSAMERDHLTTILLRYKSVIIDGFEVEEKDEEEATPELENSLWSVFKKLNPQHHQPIG